MSITYDQYVPAMATLLSVDSPTEVNYVAILPRMIEYAEDRLYRELDLIATNTEGVGDMIAGQRTVVVPDSVLIVQSAAVVTPAGVLPAAGKRNPLQRVSLEFMNYVWPSGAEQGVPLYYTMQTDALIAVAPTPDDVYKISAWGPVRPEPLSSSNQTTWLTDNLPDLFIAASMVFGSGYQRNFGAQSDDPKMAQSWENQYQLLMRSGSTDEMRRKAASVAWQPYSPTPLAREMRT